MLNLRNTDTLRTHPRSHRLTQLTAFLYPPHCAQGCTFPSHALPLPRVLPSAAWFLSAGHNDHHTVLLDRGTEQLLQQCHKASASPGSACTLTTWSPRAAPEAVQQTEPWVLAEKHHMGNGNCSCGAASARRTNWGWSRDLSAQCSAAHNKTARAEPSTEEKKPWYPQ